jgi:Phage tail tube protein
MALPFPGITERPGSLSETGIAKESSFGVPVSATTFLPMTGNTMQAEPGWFSPAVMTGNRDRQVFNLYGEAKFAGAVEGPLFPSNAIELLVAAIGTDSVSGSGPYVHTISQANTLPSLTVEKNIGGYQSLQFAGCRVGKLSIKAPVGNEPVSMSADMMGQSAAILTSPTAVSITNELPFVFSEASVTLMSHARADITNFTCEIDNGVKETYTYSGSHGPSFLTPVTVKASGTFDVVFYSLNDSVYGDFAAMEAGTLGSLAVSFTHPGGGGYSVALTMPQVALTKVGEDLKLEDVVMSTIAWEGSRSLTGGSQYTVQAAVTNQVSTAY